MFISHRFRSNCTKWFLFLIRFAHCTICNANILMHNYKQCYWPPNSFVCIHFNKCRSMIGKNTDTIVRQIYEFRFLLINVRYCVDADLYRLYFQKLIGLYHWRCFIYHNSSNNLHYFTRTMHLIFTGVSTIDCDVRIYPQLSQRNGHLRWIW